MDYLRACVFDWRKKKAIRQAKRDANLYGKKYLVLVHNGRPVCVSMQAIKTLIRKHHFARGFTTETARKIAIFEANPSK